MPFVWAPERTVRAWIERPWRSRQAWPEGRSSWFKEVIQPQVPLRLPCYDLVPVMDHTVVTVLPKVRLATSGATHSHDLTGGVYKARERIHRDIADSRLLAIPTSRSRVADSYPDYERFFWDSLPLAGLQPFVPPIVARL